MLHYEPDKSAEMITVCVAEDKPVDFCRINIEQVSVTQNDFWSIPEIQQILRLGTGAIGHEM